MIANLKLASDANRKQRGCERAHCACVCVYKSANTRRKEKRKTNDSALKYNSSLLLFDVKTAKIITTLKTEQQLCEFEKSNDLEYFRCSTQHGGLGTASSMIARRERVP